MSLRILHTNDMHGRLRGDVLARVAELRSSADLYFDTGDVIKAGNLAVPLQPDPAWAALDELRCSASTLGNRESHIVESVLYKKLEGSRHPILVGNLTRKDGSYPFPRTLLMDVCGVRVGVFGVMVPMVTRRMRIKNVSSFLWDMPVPVAIELAEELRPQCDLLVALTHIGVRLDLELAEKCQAIDAIFGGHSHTVLEIPQRVGRVAVCQGGGLGRFAGQYEWDGSHLSGGLIPLG